MGVIKIKKEIYFRVLKDVASSFDYGVGASAVTFDGTNKYIRITDIDEKSGSYSPKNNIT